MQGERYLLFGKPKNPSWMKKQVQKENCATQKTFLKMNFETIYESKDIAARLQLLTYPQLIAFMKQNKKKEMNAFIQVELDRREIEKRIAFESLQNYAEAMQATKTLTKAVEDSSWTDWTGNIGDF